MRVLVTGGSGFIGRNLQELLAPKHEVLAPRRAELDLLDGDAVRGWLKKNSVDAVVHSATTPGHRNAGKVEDLAIRNLRMFFHLAECGDSFERLIVLGSGAEYDMRFYEPKMPEAFAGTHVPADDTGFSKLLISRYVEAKRAEGRKWVHLRPFGVYGKWEDWEIRFLSNALCKAIHGLPITLRQNRKFDYVWVDDLCTVVDWFLTHDAKHAAYNVTPDASVELLALARMAREAAGNPELPIRVAEEGLGREYSGDNARLRAEIPTLSFTPVRSAVETLHAFYRENKSAIRRDALLVDK